MTSKAKIRRSQSNVTQELRLAGSNDSLEWLIGVFATKEDIDAAMRGGCGFPMGPLELLDLVGLDTSLAILEALSGDRGDPCSAPAPLLKRMVTAKQLGRKTGQGFFTYPSAR